MADAPLPLIAPETRFSRKIILGRLNRILPGFARDLLLLVRYATFPKRCDGAPVRNRTYTDGSWVGRSVTKDQEAIETYLASRDLNGVRMLHAGVGSSSIAKRFATRAAAIDGMTILEDEKAVADALLLPNYQVHLFDKYGPGLGALAGQYDYIIDNDLAGYAPCKDAFEDMLRTYLRLLAPGGSILTGVRGLSYFDNGFPIPGFYLKRLSRKLGFSITRAETFVMLTPDSESDKQPSRDPSL